MGEIKKKDNIELFVNRWLGNGKEDQDDQTFWNNIFLYFFGIEDAADRIIFQKRVVVNDNWKKIDAYIPETRTLIEQKSYGISLDKAIHQSDTEALTPYEQAKRYNDDLITDEKARWIVTSNFAEIWVYDMNSVRHSTPVKKIKLEDLLEDSNLLDFLINPAIEQIRTEEKVSKEAGAIIGNIYDKIKPEYINPDDTYSLQCLNILCVRLVFCLYAEDSGLFESPTAFHDYLQPVEPVDMGDALNKLFKVLNTPILDRDPYLAKKDPALAAFPYVNGGLFEKENIEIPPLTESIKNLLLDNASDDFNWSFISPTIFGGLFESTLNSETRHENGMHYTSIEDIHKVIDNLFLNELSDEFEHIKAISTKRSNGSLNPSAYKEKLDKLDKFQQKLASLKFLDPAAGSGNFLTETYLSLRRIENNILQLKNETELGNMGGQMFLYNGDELNPIKVSINQFYGIEINDFAVDVAKTALWIAENQMLKETEKIIGQNIPFLPLKTQANLKQGNSLRMDWNDLVPAEELSYIMGNPPFVSMKDQSEDQTDDLRNVTGIKILKQTDYVAGWYFKAADYIKNYNIECAFVSCNSITQGEQALTIWKPLLRDKGININFAYRTFNWNSGALNKASVHCVIVGFSKNSRKVKLLYDNGTTTVCKNINQYLTPGESIFIEKVGKPLISGVEVMTKGAQLIDNGNFIVGGEEERIALLKREPNIEKFVKRYFNAKDLLHNNPPIYVLYLENASPKDIQSSPFIKERVKRVYDFRSTNDNKSTRDLADRPSHYFQSQAPVSKSVVVPVVSSANRAYIPICFMPEGMVYTNALFYIDNASLYTFAVLSSKIHMEWMSMVCGRLKSDYRYSNTMAYNTFPWPNPSEEQKAMIESTGQEILNARASFPDSSLADIYAGELLEPSVAKAHNRNDIAVMEAYGFYRINNGRKEMYSMAESLAELMKMYQNLVNKK